MKYDARTRRISLPTRLCRCRRRRIHLRLRLCLCRRRRIHLRLRLCHCAALGILFDPWSNHSVGSEVEVKYVRRERECEMTTSK